MRDISLTVPLGSKSTSRLLDVVTVPHDGILPATCWTDVAHGECSDDHVGNSEIDSSSQYEQQQRFYQLLLKAHGDPSKLDVSVLVAVNSTTAGQTRPLGFDDDEPVRQNPTHPVEQPSAEIDDIGKVKSVSTNLHM
jgi:hypothetical protein